MATVRINCHDRDGEPSAYFLTLDSGESFITVRVSDDASFVLSGYDSKAVATAHALADELKDVANRLASRLQSAQPAPTLTPEAEAIEL